jgi:hypothetical protein
MLNKIRSLLRKPKGRSPDGEQFIALPTARTATSRGDATVPLFIDKAVDLDWQAYKLIYEADTTLQPILRYSRKCAGFTPVVIGSGERRDQVQELVDATEGMPECIENLSLAMIEAWRGQWMRAVPHGNRVNISMKGGSGRKVQAGGDFWWGGPAMDDVIKLRPLISQWDEKSRNLPRKQVMIFHPSASVNPDEATDLARALAINARLTRQVLVAMHVYTEKFSLPMPVYKKMVEEMDAAGMTGALTEVGKAVAQLNSLSSLSQDKRESLQLLEASGQTWEFLVQIHGLLQRQAQRLITGEQLTGERPGASGDGGSAELDEKQFFSVASYVMKMMAEPFTSDYLRLLEELNDYWLAPAEKDAPPLWIEFRPPVEKNRLTVAELLQAIDRRIPLSLDTVYSVLGIEQPTDPDKVFLMPQAEGNGGGDTPSSTGESVQRKDREVPDSGIPGEMTRSQDRDGDMRNVKRGE